MAADAQAVVDGMRNTVVGLRVANIDENDSKIGQTDPHEKGIAADEEEQVVAAERRDGVAVDAVEQGR